MLLLFLTIPVGHFFYSNLYEVTTKSKFRKESVVKYRWLNMHLLAEINTCMHMWMDGWMYV